MGVKSQMPWDALRGGIIRQVIRELGFQDYGSMRKDEMIDYLHTVETSGCMSMLLTNVALLLIDLFSRKSSSVTEKA